MIRSFLMLLFCAVAAVDATATTFTVTYTDQDLGDIDPGDGECAWATFPPPELRCTLRAAIMEANALAGTDIIIVPFGAHIVLDNLGRNEDGGGLGDLDITAPLTIMTPSVDTRSRATIDANGIDRVFDIRFGAGDVTLSNLTITNGLANDATTVQGGGIRADGAGLLNVEFCELVDNVANAGGAIAIGTASGRSLLVYDTAIHANGVFEFGFTNPLGSAIKDSDSAPAAGAAITIRRSTISANLAFGTLARAAVQVSTPLLIENSTFSFNAPDAIRVHATNATLNHVTITGSQTGYGFSGNLLTNASFVRNTIIAGNSVGDCQFLGSYGFSHSYTLDSDGTCLLGGFGVGNLPMTDPMLRPLALLYGDTPVHDLNSGSPAIDHGDTAMQGSGGSCLSRDQDARRFPGLRSTGGSADHSAALLQARAVHVCCQDGTVDRRNAPGRIRRQLRRLVDLQHHQRQPAVEVFGGTHEPHRQHR